MSVSFFFRLLGRPLPRSSAKDERLPNVQALPILSWDALFADHRVIYGADGAAFLKDLAELIENRAESLLL